jgi:hypothetical protein
MGNHDRVGRRIPLTLEDLSQEGIDKINAQMQIYAKEDKDEEELEDYIDLPDEVQRPLAPPKYTLSRRNCYFRKSGKTYHYIFGQNGPFNEQQFMGVVLEKAREANKESEYAVEKKGQCYDLSEDGKAYARFCFKELLGDNKKWVLAQYYNKRQNKLKALLESVDSCA